MIIQEPQQGPVNLEPGVMSSYKNGLDKLSKNLGVFLLIFLITLIVGIPSGISGWFGYDLNTISAVNTLLFFYSLLISSPVEFGVSYAYLRGARGEKPEVNDVGIVLKNYLNVVLAGFLYGIIVMVGFFLLIIPGIIFACKLAFVRYLVTDQKMSAIDAIDTSWKMTSGYAFDIFLMGLLAIPIFIAGFLVFGVGVIFSVMWVESAFASMYHAVSTEKKWFAPKVDTEENQTPQGPIIS